MTEREDTHVELLTSPLRKGLVSRVFVVGGPIGLLLAILASLWVSYLHVRHTVSVHMEPHWVAGETLAIRAQILPEHGGVSVDGAVARAWVEQGAQRFGLAQLALTPRPGLLQTTFVVPELETGRATVHVELRANEFEPRTESISVEVVERAPRRPGTPTVAGSTLQYADDSDPQPPGFRIDIMPSGRLLSEFDNELWVRVMREDARPYSGPIEVRLIGGEFAERTATSDSPVPLLSGQTDALGLATIRGRLTSEVIRVELEVLSAAEEPKVLAKRRVRLVSFAGAIRIETRPQATFPGGDVELTSLALRQKLPVFIDVFDGDGRWVDTVQPPFVGGEPPRQWAVPAGDDDLLQLEAYHFTHAVGEATAVARIQLAQAGLSSGLSLEPLLAAHREAVDIARVDKTYDAKLERAYLDAVSDAVSNVRLSRAGVERARAFLLGTLPLRVHGPPLQLATRERDLAAIARFQRRWTIGLRIFLLGGGGLFLLAMTIMMVRAHTAAAEETMRAIERLGDAEAGLEVAEDLARSRRGAFIRGVAVIGVMAAGLVLTTAMLESLLWVF